MAVYFIQDTGTGAIKIGYSADPETRLRQLQTGSAYGLKLLGAIEGDAERERYFHRMFEEWKLAGEWFTGTTASCALALYIIGFYQNVAAHGAEIEDQEAKIKELKEQVLELTGFLGCAESLADMAEAAPTIGF